MAGDEEIDEMETNANVIGVVSLRDDLQLKRD